VFLVANIYPTFTFADDPRRFVTGKAAQAAFRQSVDRYQQDLWRMVQTAAGSPWFLGQRFSALDIYIAAMTQLAPSAPMVRRPLPSPHRDCRADRRAAEAERRLAPQLSSRFGGANQP